MMSMFEPTERLRKVAAKVLDNALPIRSDEVAVFYAGAENLDLAYAFAGECEARGTETIVQTCGDYVWQTRFLKAPLKTFSRKPRVSEALVNVADWFIYFTGSSHDNSIYQRPDLKNRVIEIRKRSKSPLENLLQLCLKKKTHLVALLDPNLEQATALGKSYRQTREMFLKSLDINYENLTLLGQRLISKMQRGGEIHLTCPRGSDVTLCADARLWVNDDGKLAPASSGVTRYVHNIPVGEVFVAPIESSARGVIYPVSLPGSLVSGICIKFRGSEKAVISAKSGYEFMKPRLDSATGNPYCIAEFAFGTNPCGNILLATEKAYGTTHVAIGQNTWLGGKNECSIHWDFVIDKPTVTIDDKPVLRNGEFTV
jgi:leucyl aminopeptidase (aminopeptidase T)